MTRFELFLFDASCLAVWLLMGLYIYLEVTQ